jgi:hypothetical protein
MTRQEALMLQLVLGNFYIENGLNVANGKILACCRRCHRPYEWEGDIEDFEMYSPMNLCGSSPQCCP